MKFIESFYGILIKTVEDMVYTHSLRKDNITCCVYAHRIYMFLRDCVIINDFRSIVVSSNED